MTDSIVISYHDSVLRQSDLALLSAPNWLNDQIISFFYEYLSNEEINDPRIGYVDPSLVQLVKLCAEPFEADAMLQSLNLSAKEIVLIPINDEESGNAGGTHWSLLVWFRQTEKFVHFNSISNSNVKAAKRSANSFATSIGAKVPFKIVDADVVAQKNTYDCGLHVLSISHQICINFLTGARKESFYFDKKAVHISHFRERLQKIVGRMLKTYHPSQVESTSPLQKAGHAFNQRARQYIHETVLVPVGEFEVLNKMNEATGFQIGKIENEVASISARLVQMSARDNEIDVLLGNLSQLIIDLEQMNSNVSKIDSYTKKLEEAIKSHLKTL
ncbi:Oidioi.mRNA.OKI2018_I69.XSR.g14736.t1.cds [Oikopleura dioica]|uniref:Oidioi.mRNA.OKI2018_I69.XSR.g14736.t1.cds n=1 Tax=Oikopleura dioica TaxID=34765 RepID=A0ABN7SAQ6_OIKDI|nr:Oidioi.mRNA.OKI2018_I69.XSR.g14736.t1.cds [Oikopleura dioica]